MRIPGKPRWTLWPLLGLTFCSASVLAQAPPLSLEFVANTYSTGSQSAPDVASDGKGAFVVVWDSIGEDGDLDGIFGQRFSPTGARADIEFGVNTYTTGSQFAARIAMNRTGDFVVVWTGAGQDGGATGIFGQRFGPLGIKVGAEFPVNTYTTGLQGEPAVAIDDAGDFVVVWSSSGQDGSGYGVFAQRFAASGTKSGSEIPVNTYTTADQHEPVVAMDEAGNFTVVWSSSGQDGDGEGVFGQRFEAAGGKRGPEFPVNTHTASDERFPAIASDKHGNFVVAWADHNLDQSSYGVVLRRFHADGESFGPEFLVDEYTEESQSFPAIAMGPAGDFIITWASYEQDGSSWGTFGQSYERLGGRIGDNFRINATTVGAQDGGRVAHDGTGFVAVWNEPNQDGSGSAVVGRRQNVRAGGLSVDVRGFPGSTDLNGVFEPAEAVRVEPLWINQSESPVLGDLQGTVSVFTGPSGPNYQLLDGTATYGSLLPHASAGCGSGAPEGCYAVQAGGTRPAAHWDTLMPENMSIGGTHYWKLHIGESFTDVPRSQPFYKKIETMLHHDITSGCTLTEYCPSSTVSREQMAIFIAKGIAGAAPLIPNEGTISGQPYTCGPGGVSRFADVAPTDASCRHVHFLAAQNVTLGCNATQFCPGQDITRDAMASFIAKAVVAPGGGNAVPITYGPDPDTGLSYSCAAGSPNVHFSDVPPSNTFCKHIHFLWAKGIVAGCSGTQFCPGGSVARDAMAKFIANGFGLQLYAP
jgi:hypothetical protein